MLFSVVKIIAAVYLLLAVILFLFQSKMVYFPTSRLEIYPDAAGLDYQQIQFQAADGVELSAWFVPAEEHEPRRPVVLLCHGNGGNISHRVDTLMLLHRLGFSTFIFDYRGYGQSKGSPSEAGTYLDAEAAWKYLTETKNFLPGEIILMGRSLGGAVAANLAVGKNPRALILESSFTSIPDIASHYYPYFPVRLLSRFKYNTVDYVKQVSCPVLVIHSPADDIVPYKLGQKLFQAAPQPKQFLKITGDHNHGFLNSGPTYTTPLKTFLDNSEI